VVVPGQEGALVKVFSSLPGIASHPALANTGLHDLLRSFADESGVGHVDRLVGLELLLRLDPFMFSGETPFSNLSHCPVTYLFLQDLGLLGCGVGYRRERTLLHFFLHLLVLDLDCIRVFFYLSLVDVSLHPAHLLLVDLCQLTLVVKVRLVSNVVDALSVRVDHMIFVLLDPVSVLVIF
jgi:hypothetical protein